MLQGIGVSVGIGFAQAMVWQAPVTHDYVPRKSGNPDVEIGKLDAALKTIRGRNHSLRTKTARRLGKSEAVIFDAYDMILSDEEALVGPTRDKIRLRSLSAEYAVTIQFGEIARRFLEMNNDYMRQRAEDVIGLRDQLLREMMGVPTAEANHLKRPTVVVANALTPSDIANLDLSRLEGIVCEEGGYSSHMAIIARSLGIPAVVGVAAALEKIPNGAKVALDGETGEVWVSPKEQELPELRRRFDVFMEKRNSAQLFRGRATISVDGHRVELSANVGQLEEIRAALDADAESIGMYRTELMYDKFDAPPTEEQQLTIYRNVLERAGGKAVTVRTFDDGGQGIVEGRGKNGANPSLGFRGIRMSLGRPSFFRTQLRALLRASAYGNLKVLFPMVSSLEELLQAVRAVESIMEELRREKRPFDEEIPVGIMISVPSAALLSDEFAKHVSFFTININDIIQFALAVDRGSSELAYMYQQYHPAVLRLIKITVDSAHKRGIPCYLSGDAPYHEKVLPLMLGLGVDGFSMNPRMILPTRQTLNSCCYEDCRRLADEVLECCSSSDVVHRLERFETCVKETG